MLIFDALKSEFRKSKISINQNVLINVKNNFYNFKYFIFETFSFAQNEYFLTLRNDKVNLRQGPSFKYPVKIFYKKFLPVLIQDQHENFRKIKDHENNSGWIHISQLSKKKLQ